MFNETKIFILAQFNHVLEYFTDSDIIGFRGFLLSLTPYILSLTSMNQVLSTVSAISGIIWIWVCIYFKVKASKNKENKEKDE